MSWKEENNAIHSTFEFKNFNKVLSFGNEVGEIAEEKQHHPNILIHDYNQVDITLTTHVKGKVTEKDHDVAGAIDTLEIPGQKILFIIAKKLDHCGSLQDTAEYGWIDNSCGLIVNASRSILYTSGGEDFAEKAREKAQEIQNEMAKILVEKGFV